MTGQAREGEKRMNAPMTDEEKREKHRECARRWIVRNREWVNAYRRVYYHAHRGCAAEREGPYEGSLHRFLSSPLEHITITTYSGQRLYLSAMSGRAEPD